MHALQPLHHPRQGAWRHEGLVLTLTRSAIESVAS